MKSPPKRPAAAKNVDEAISLIDGICRISLECDGPEIERYHLKILRAILSGDETLQSLDKKAAVVNQERRQTRRCTSEILAPIVA
jgi:hypothetical protein